MRWCTELIVSAPYFIIGFVDRNLTVPLIGTYIYLGVGVLGEASAAQYCFRDAQSFLAEPGETEEPSYIALSEDMLDMVADKPGLIAWLQSPYSTGTVANEV